MCYFSQPTWTWSWDIARFHVPPCLFTHPWGDTRRAMDVDGFPIPLILLPESECEKGWGSQLLHVIALLYMGNNLC